MRFTGTKITDSKGRQGYESRLFPKNTKMAGDTYVQTVPGDRLDLIANQFYGDPSLWYVIANANHIGKGTMAVETGIQLRIPVNPYSGMGTMNQGY